MTRMHTSCSHSEVITGLCVSIPHFILGSSSSQHVVTFISAPVYLSNVARYCYYDNRLLLESEVD